MPYITREDGEHFVIPSYRDVIAAKSASSLKKEVLTLSASYGEYITLQEKGPIQYEVAFSPDIGYLLGESVWHQFKRPLDMIYCEAIPNTSEALLVIVKDGSVYLDGSFPIESIPEELVIFLTQQSHFKIWVYGDVPISEKPEEGKFCFESASVASFTVLDTPVFPTLPLLGIYRLQLVDTVLKAHGVGVFPVKKVVTGVVIVAVLWLMWTYMTAPKEAVRNIIISQTDPYGGYELLLASPAPDQEIKQFVEKLNLIFAMPGWYPKQLDYAKGTLKVPVLSSGSNIQTIKTWAHANDATLNMDTKGVTLTFSMSLPNRSVPTNIYPLSDVIINFVDKLALIYPGNRVKFTNFSKKGSAYSETTITISIDKLSPATLLLIANECKDLPLALNSISLKSDNGLLSGKISLDAAGS